VQELNARIVGEINIEGDESAFVGSGDGGKVGIGPVDPL
jgi:hypothetical protein